MIDPNDDIEADASDTSDLPPEDDAQAAPDASIAQAASEPTQAAPVMGRSARNSNHP